MQSEKYRTIISFLFFIILSLVVVRQVYCVGIGLTGMDSPEMPQLQTAVPVIMQPGMNVDQTTVVPEQEKSQPHDFPGPEQTSSEFERYLDAGISQYGYNLFGHSSFTPASQVPVGPDYVIGPGDEICISVWGSIDGQWNPVVDRNGRISLPKIGNLGVAGLNFEQLKDVVQREIAKYYKGFKMNISMGALRTIRVYVVGHAHRPGSYTISSLSTLVSALFETGGPAKTGSMRGIRVERNGRTETTFDVYDFLMRGDKSKDIRLMSEDVIFIPPVGDLVGITGSVHAPAIYELKGETRFGQLIDMAGGLSAVAFKGRVQIERIVDNRCQVVFESDLDTIKNSDLSLQSGDMMKIFTVVQDKKMVRLSGAVKRDGEFGFSPGMRISDLISMAGGIEYFTYDKEAELTRVTVTDQGPKTEKILIDLKKAIRGDEQHDILLKADDYLFIRPIPEWHLYRTATVGGEVRFPGTYTFHKGEKLSSLLGRAGGYTDTAYLRGAVLIRESVRQLQQKGLEEMINRLERELLAQSSMQVSTSLSSDEVQARKAEMEAKQRFIEILRKQKATGRLVIRLAHLRLLKGSMYDIEIEDGDSITIPTRQSVVNITGSVMSQGSFIYSTEHDYKDYIALSGGYAQYADEGNVYVLKVDGSARKLSRGLFSWNDRRARWEVSAFGEDIPPLESGDTIVVPEKLDRIAWLREIKDITQILMQIAVVAGVVDNLY